MIFQTTMGIITRIIQLFSFILFIRVMLTWFPHPGLDRVKQFLGAITDPYLDKFRGIPWLRFGMLDFSPVLAFILLGLAMQITGDLSAGQSVTLFSVLVVLIRYVWGFAAFWINIIIVILIIFLVANLMNRNIMLGGLNNLLYQITDRIMALFGKTSYHMVQGIVVSLVTILALRILLGYGFTQLIRLLYRL